MIAHLGDDLQKAFPGESGFSRTNVYHMRALFLPDQGAEKIVPQLVGQISETGLLPAVAGLPWGQNVVLIEQIKDLRERLWYARATPKKDVDLGRQRYKEAKELAGDGQG